MIQVIQLLLNKKFNSEKGFTLVELMIVLVFISLVVGLVSAIYISANKTSIEVIDITRSEIDSRLAIMRISRDIRETSSITSAENDQISFLSNVDADDSYEEINYSMESEDGYYNLVRSVDGGASRIIATHLIQDNIFIYYSEISEDAIDTPVTLENLENIRLIEINVSIDQSGSQSLRTMDLDTIVALRNKI